jgi:hypothetical protein
MHAADDAIGLEHDIATCGRLITAASSAPNAPGCSASGTKYARNQASSPDSASLPFVHRD